MQNLYGCRFCGKTCDVIPDERLNLPPIMCQFHIYSCEACHSYFIMLDNAGDSFIRQDLSVGIYDDKRKHNN